MRHIKLFENFDQSQEMPGVIFDWIPFDNEVNNPINSSIPTEIGLQELMEYCKSNPEIGKVGLFIAHKKNPGGGFNRYIASSTNPLRFDSAVFDSDYKKINEVTGIDPYKTSLGSFDKGSSMMGRFGIFGED
jgi:hypothetical protein